MNQLVDVISNNIPSIAKELTGIVFIIFLILNISDDFDKIKLFIKKVLNIRGIVDKLYYSRKRDKYNAELSTMEFLDWQYEVMDKIYSPLIDEINKKLKNRKCSIHMTQIEFDDVDTPQRYEAITIEIGKGIKYPFENVCEKKRLNTNFFSNISELSKKNNKKIIRDYMKIIESTIRYPKRVGYMLDKVDIDYGKINLTAYVDVYENNVKTSHVLEYELYRLYKKINGKKKYANLTREDLLNKLPLRNEIHTIHKKNDNSNDIINECEVLLSGKGRQSLLSVQMFVIIKNKQNSYDALRIRRSSNVSVKANFLQFIPSGGFEAMNDCNDFDSQWDNYSIPKVLFRELLEECFGQDEDDKQVTGNNVSPEKIYTNKNIKKILHLLDEDNPKAELELIGLTMSLVGLRQELCFILKIDDESIAEEFASNYESRSAIHFVDIHNLEDASFWIHNYENDLRLLNCTSAGLFELARKSSIYINALKHKH